jgi:1-acyl-sn-glycerol-3-phosphate acyltransferase
VLQRLRDYLITYALLGTLAVMIIGWTLLALVLIAPLPERHRRGAARRSMSSGFRLFGRFLSLSGAYHFDLAALEPLRTERGLILAPNHPSAFDAIILLMRHPDLACVMKPALLNNPLLGAGARLAGYIRSEPPRRLVKSTVTELGRGAAVLLFPEGTRTVHRPVNALTASVAVIAKHARAPIQIAFIETDSPYLSKGWPPLKAPRLPIHYRVRLGPRIAAPQDVAACMRTLEAEYAAALAAAPQNAWLSAPAAQAP